MTAVEQPITISEPSIPERRRRPSTDIIDVDLLDDRDIINSQRPFQRRRLSERPIAGSSVHNTQDTIIILDSDDEQPAAGSSQQARNRRLFSPPPPPQNNVIPPVPPVPRQFIDQPMRRRPPAFPSSLGVIRPNQEPFPFEANFRSPTPYGDPLPPLAAAPSHHVPAMGLGGAIISFNRHILSEEQAQQREAQRRRQHNLEQNIGRRVSNLYRAAIRRLSGGHFVPRAAQEEEDEVLAQIIAAEADANVGSTHMNHLHRSRNEEPHYLPSFTHPGNPAPGFTFDFGPSSASSSPKISAKPPTIDVDEAPVASTSALKVEDTSTLLVCARCLDPLVLGGGDDGRMRLWGLRCGHLIDGKCLEEIMKPSPIVEGKGKATEEAPETTPLDMGKGKQKEVLPSDGGTTDSAYSASEPEPEPAPNPMLSRLRRRQFGYIRPPTAPPIHFPRPSRQRQVAHWPLGHSKTAKGKGKNKKLPVDASHEWMCPVPGCERVHVSSLVGGRWVQESKRGAIGVYA